MKLPHSSLPIRSIRIVLFALSVVAVHPICSQTGAVSAAAQ